MIANAKPEKPSPSLRVGDVAFVIAPGTPRLRIVSAVADEYVCLFEFYKQIEFRQVKVRKSN